MVPTYFPVFFLGEGWFFVLYHVQCEVGGPKVPILSKAWNLFGKRVWVWLPWEGSAGMRYFSYKIKRSCSEPQNPQQNFGHPLSRLRLAAVLSGKDCGQEHLPLRHQSAVSWQGKKLELNAWIYIVDWFIYLIFLLYSFKISLWHRMQSNDGT